MKKMQDVYYLEKRLYSTGSVIIIGNDQLKDTPAYLLSFLLETISIDARLVSKTGRYDFKTAL